MVEAGALHTARQPPRPISIPPSGGPATAIVCVETASSVWMLAGLSRPVRCASRRMRYPSTLVSPTSVVSIRKSGGP